MPKEPELEYFYTLELDADYGQRLIALADNAGDEDDVEGFAAMLLGWAIDIAEANERIEVEEMFADILAEREGRVDAIRSSFEEDEDIPF